MGVTGTVIGCNSIVEPVSVNIYQLSVCTGWAADLVRHIIYSTKYGRCSSIPRRPITKVRTVNNI